MSIDKQSIFEKTPKGIIESKGRWGIFASSTQKLLALVDGKSTVEQLLSISGMKEQKFLDEMEGFLQERLIRECWKPNAQFTVNATPQTPQGMHVTVANTQAYMDAVAKQKTGAEKDEEDDLLSFDDIEEKLRREGEQLAARAEAERQLQIEKRVREEAEQKGREEAERKAREATERQAREEKERLAREEAERKVREEAEQKAREEAERLAREEAEHMAREEAERQAREEEERLAREEAERKAREEAEQKAREEAERLAREEAERVAREEAERMAREEAERQAREEEERLAREEAERKAREEAEQKAREEAERLAREEAERMAREAAERQAREEEERLAREETERKAREEAEQKAREEAERLAREEAERTAREAAERQAREEEERLAREEAERKEREEAEQKAREEAERLAREEAERKARDARLAKRLEAREKEERRIREDAERKSREEEERKAREELERKAREEAERKKREETERKIQEEAERKAREKSEQKARKEADRLAREEAVRMAREEAERKAREEEERRAREEVERKAHEETAQKAREEAERLAHKEAERKAREESKRLAREEAEREAREEAERIDREEVVRLTQEEAERLAQLEAVRIEPAHEREEIEPGLRMAKALRALKWGAAAALLLLAIGLAGIQFVPLSSAQKQLEQLVGVRLGEPVKINALHIAFFPSPHLKLKQIEIGAQSGIRVADARIYAGWGTLLGNERRVERIEMERVDLAAGSLETVATWPARSSQQQPVYQIQQVTLRYIEIAKNDVSLPPLRGEFNFSNTGSLENAWLGSEDGSLKADFSPAPGGLAVSLSAREFTPFGFLPVKVDSLQASGTVSGQQLRFAELNGTSHGGKVSGSLTLSWGSGWSAAGDVRVVGANIAPASAAPEKPFISGKLDAAVSISQQAKIPEHLFRQALLTGSATLQGGAVAGFDLQSTIHYDVEAIYSGQTAFDSWTFKLDPVGDKQAYKVRIAGTGLLLEGRAEVSAQGAMSGTVKLQVESKKKTVRGNYTLGGSLDRPTIHR